MSSVPYEDLWMGPELKREYASFHLHKIEQAVQPPELDGTYAAIRSSGKILDTGWQRTIGAHFDAFLAAARSIADIIDCCFGADKQMNLWLKGLLADEQDRRVRFSKQFYCARNAFFNLSLSKTRRTTLHRRGYAPYEITIAGRFGLTNVGGPTQPLPTSETPNITDPSFPSALARASAVEPRPNDFTIDGQPLFISCREYMWEAGALITEGRKIAALIQGSSNLTPPPDA